MATKTQITVQIRPSHLQHEAYVLNYALHYQFDCVLVCDDQTYPLHREVLSLATGLVKRKFDMGSEAIVVHKRLSIGYHHWDMDQRLNKGPPHKAQLRNQDLPDNKGGQDAPINDLSIVDNARKERDLGGQGVVPHCAETPVPLGSGSYEKLAHDKGFSREMREMHYLAVFAKAGIPNPVKKIQNEVVEIN
ncbi:hypothetical protein TCAL_13374 [Tigriopus californicus]|uniref:Uncharacterized protein n=1 Tax=Tigriopus californicus TaxID=6832 RepID=A0A553PS61_TIGCA|nr:hypothetical protein TCAL_13374 [Tigriopus californicus]|eukprot:TCALIF_13374-PA protein Name:"Protein of unknown function" AED:0.07 eAED:0.07 QI:29/0.5/0.66/1/1/1/3/70/190